MKVQQFTVTLNPGGKELQSDIAKIIGSLFSDGSWKQPVKIQRFNDGLTNAVICASCEGLDPKDWLLFRIYGDYTDLVIDRKLELKNMILLNEHNFIPPVYAAFNNGIVHGYIPGSVFKTLDVLDPKLSRIVAEEMAILHTAVPTPAGERSALFSLFEKILHELKSITLDDAAKQEIFTTRFPPHDDLLAELQYMKKELPSLNSPIVLCHNDLLPKNIIYSSATDSVSFIDYEYSFFNFQAFDIANHFCEFAGTGGDGVEIDFDRYPDKQFQMVWLKQYLDKFHKEKHLAAPTDRDLNNLYVAVNKFSIASHFLWSMWSIIQAKFSEIDFDYLRFGYTRLEAYFRFKQRFANLRLSADGLEIQHEENGFGSHESSD